MAVGTEAYYLAKIRDILFQYSVNYPGTPTQLLDHMYIGSYQDAENVAYLRRLGITHVLNCAAYRTCTANPYPCDSGIVGYEQFNADDDVNYNILQHFPRARAFIDRVKYAGGKVLVHCAMGINRSGAIAIAYMMVDQKLRLLDAIRTVKMKRNAVLCNRGFQRQVCPSEGLALTVEKN